LTLKDKLKFSTENSVGASSKQSTVVFTTKQVSKALYIYIYIAHRGYATNNNCVSL